MESERVLLFIHLDSELTIRERAYMGEKGVGGDFGHNPRIRVIQPYKCELDTDSQEAILLISTLSSLQD